MADTLTGFDPDAFRTQITNTMIMGLPQLVAERPTFYFRSVSAYPAGTMLDSEGRPIDPRIASTVTTASTPIQVPCAVEFTPDTSDDEELVGTYVSTRVVITLLDIHYTQVATAIEVNLGTRRYNITFAEPPIGLGPVTVYRLHCFPKGV